jgi:hypothetical protein
MLAVIAIVFVLGYIAIALEHPLKINKTASALMIGALCWALYAISAGTLLPESKIPAEFIEHYSISGRGTIVDPDRRNGWHLILFDGCHDDRRVDRCQ